VGASCIRTSPGHAAHVSGDFTDVVSNMGLVRAFGAAQREQQRLSVKIQDEMQAQRQACARSSGCASSTPWRYSLSPRVCWCGRWSSGAEGSNPSLLIGACIVLPQIIVALASPAVGRFADRYGRRLVLIIGFLMLPMRALVFSMTSNSALVIGVQVLDGIAGAGFGILVPLVVSDVAARSGHFNLPLGAVGFAIGIGSTLSTSAAGWVADHFGMRHAFYFLASVGLAAVLLAVFAMPETRPEPEEDAGAAASAGRASSTAPPPPRPPRGE